MALGHHAMTGILASGSKSPSKGKDHEWDRNHCRSDETECAEGPGRRDAHEHCDESQILNSREDISYLLWIITIGSHPAHVSRKQAAAVRADRVPAAGYASKR